MGSRFHIWSSVFVAEALRGLSRNKLRSALAALGITIGIAAVVGVVSIGNAGSDFALKQLEGLGDNLVWIEAGSRNVNGVRTGTHGMTNLTEEDAEAILREVPLIKSISPQVDGSVLAINGRRNWTTHYRGVSPDYLDIKRWVVAQGAPFTDVQMERVANVCLIGQTVRGQLFGGEEPVGKEIRIMSQVYRVIGVLGAKGQSATGQDQDDTLLLPYTTAQKRLRGKGFTWVDDIMCSAISAEAVNPAISKIIPLLRERHQIRAGQEDDFNIRRPEELIKQEIETNRTLSFFLIGVASISLLVGGIGIMNVMLVAVTGRTREIGLRLAVGATEFAVLAQFLGEALMLCFFGGVAGVLLGVAGSFAMGRAFEWPMSIPLQVLVIAPAFSAAVGVCFGLYPAWRAAHLDPIDALRHE